MSPQTREVIEMTDHRKIASDDNWQTAVTISPDGKVTKKLKGANLELARFIAVSHSSWQGNAS